MQDDNLKRDDENIVDNADYIDALKELKANSVDKDKYEALKSENKRLLEAIVNGDDIEIEKKEDLKSAYEYCKNYQENKFSTDLDYWTNIVNLRKATIAEHGNDPCVTGSYGLDKDGNHVEPSYGEPEAVEEQFKIIEDLIEQADGNPATFKLLMQSARGK